MSKLSKSTTFRILVTKASIMAFQGKYPVRSKIVFDNRTILEQALDLNTCAVKLLSIMTKICTLNSGNFKT